MLPLYQTFFSVTLFFALMFLMMWRTRRRRTCRSLRRALDTAGRGDELIRDRAAI